MFPPPTGCPTNRSFDLESCRSIIFFYAKIPVTPFRLFRLIYCLSSTFGIFWITEFNRLERDKDLTVVSNAERILLDGCSAAAT